MAWNKTKKPSQESPTDQEHRLGDRADHAYRVQLIFFGCLIHLNILTFFPSDRREMLRRSRCVLIFL